MFRCIFSATAQSFSSAILVLTASTSLAAEVKQVEVQRVGGRIDIQSELVINASISEVYTALLNYDDFSEMGNTFADSRYIEPATDGTPRIYTRTEGCIWFFCKTIERFARLEVEPQRKITAIAEPEHSDAALSIESWTLTAAGNRTIIEYQHQLETGFWVPPLIGALIINRSVENGTRKAAVTIESIAIANRNPTLAKN